MSLETESQLADDFAFIAAARTGAKGVTAACVEETREPPGLMIRIAANEGVSMETREALVQICKCLMSCARTGQSIITSYLHCTHEVAETRLDDGVSEVSRLTINLCRERIMERLKGACSGRQPLLLLPQRRIDASRASESTR
jgi:hypothetical protein